MFAMEERELWLEIGNDECGFAAPVCRPGRSPSGAAAGRRRSRRGYRGLHLIADKVMAPPEIDYSVTFVASRLSYAILKTTIVWGGDDQRSAGTISTSNAFPGRTLDWLSGGENNCQYPPSPCELSVAADIAISRRRTVRNARAQWRASSVVGRSRSTIQTRVPRVQGRRTKIVEEGIRAGLSSDTYARGGRHGGPSSEGRWEVGVVRFAQRNLTLSTRASSFAGRVDNGNPA